MAAGCAWNEQKYLQKRAEADCELALECYDEAVLTLYGWTDVETCIADHGPALAAEGQGCTYDKRKAKPCVREVAASPCPAEGEELEAPACDAVYVDCGGGDSGS